MKYTTPDSRQGQPLLIFIAVIALLAFGIGYYAGAKGLTLNNAGLGPTTGPAATDEGIDCFFSPKGGCTDGAVAEIEKAQKEIEMQAYSFTSQPIAQALVAAHHRGVKVTVVLDKSQVIEKGSMIREVADDKIPTYNRRQARHCPQQDHPDRRPGDHHRQLQLHQSGRAQ